MGIFDWIKQASISASAREKERAYWWVSKAQRKKCRKIIDEGWRSANTLILPWDAWHNCMQQESKPASEYKIVKDIRWLSNFIKEIVGIKEEKIVVKEIPPLAPWQVPELYEKYKKRKKELKKKLEKAERERKRKIIEKAERERKEREEYFPEKLDITPIIIEDTKVIKPRFKDRSHLSFNLFSGALRWRNLKKPDFLLKFENIEEKILEKISMITGEKK